MTFVFPKVKWLHYTGKVSKCICYWCQIFSVFYTPESLKSVNFWQSYLKNKKVDVLWDTVYNNDNIRAWRCRCFCGSATRPVHSTPSSTRCSTASSRTRFCGCCAVVAAATTTRRSGWVGCSSWHARTRTFSTAAWCSRGDHAASRPPTSRNIDVTLVDWSNWRRFATKRAARRLLYEVSGMAIKRAESRSPYRPKMQFVVYRCGLNKITPQGNMN